MDWVNVKVVAVLAAAVSVGAPGTKRFVVMVTAEEHTPELPAEPSFAVTKQSYAVLGT